MGACTSSVKHRRKQKQQHRQLHKRSEVVLDNKQLSPIPLTILRNQRPHSLADNLDVQSSPSKDPLVDQINSSSLIQLYSLNNNNNINCMSSSSSTSHTAPRIPVAKSRLPISGSIRPQYQSTNPTGINQSMSTKSRPGLPPTPQNPTQTRFGFIPRPTTSGLQQAQGSSLVERSRSISPSSTNSANSSPSASVSQRTAKPTSTRSTTNASKPKLPPSSHPKDPPKSTTTTTTTTNRVRAKAPSETSTPVSATKTDVNVIRDRYKTPNRSNFFNRRTTGTNSLKSPALETPIIEEEKNEPITSVSIENTELKSESSPPVSSSQGDSAYTSATLPSNRSPSGQYSQANQQRQRNPSTLSSSSLLSDVLNQDIVLDDDNCSLKSDDLLCDYDDTLTLDSASKNDPTDSCSSNSLSIDSNKKPTKTTAKPQIPPFQTVLKDHRASTIAKCSNVEKKNSNLQESLDELGRLSSRMDSLVDNEQNRRLLTRSVSLKPPPTSLPPREDGEQITMDIESYRQVMKDVMVVKTILHQLDRLLKHSDGANMTDSMIGSFHESMISSRHFPSSGVDGNARNSLDENSSYDDLLKEIFTLRKEREQDKQTIKLLQEQMYKYSSQTND